MFWTGWVWKVGSVQLPLAALIQKRPIGPTQGGEQQNSSLCDGSPLLLRDITATQKELQGTSKNSKMSKDQPYQIARSLQKPVLPGSQIGFAERPFFFGLAPGHLEAFRFRRHPAIETHCLARTGWGSNPREK
jgi:hypothetical protein